MREISAELIGKEITRLCIEANLKLPADIRKAMEEARRTEPWPVAADTLQVLCDICAPRMSVRCLCARIPVWPACFLRLVRMYILQAT